MLVYLRKTAPITGFDFWTDCAGLDKLKQAGTQSLLQPGFRGWVTPAIDQDLVCPSHFDRQKTLNIPGRVGPHQV
jgi:hypothetical protein